MGQKNKQMGWSLVVFSPSCRCQRFTMQPQWGRAVLPRCALVKHRLKRQVFIMGWSVLNILCGESGSPPFQLPLRVNKPSPCHPPILQPEWKHSNVACVTWDVAASLILTEGLTDTPVFPLLCCLLFISRNFLWCIKCILRVWWRGVHLETKGVCHQKWVQVERLPLNYEGWQLSPKGEVPQT